ncbi:MAG: hypothetical protein MZW92_54745 [Comamonadaceae bacterium]|nr:hypothetical protein [Comamonadaceae bacterium]
MVIAYRMHALSWQIMKRMALPALGRPAQHPVRASSWCPSCCRSDCHARARWRADGAGAGSTTPRARARCASASTELHHAAAGATPRAPPPMPSRKILAAPEQLRPATGTRAAAWWPASTRPAAGRWPGRWWPRR